MKILRMSASFGSLQNAELTLHDGLNVVTAPNESGKSTWASFLLAMLYGVDSGERSTKTNLPVKTKYKPWSGAPMEGRMELEWQGRKITLERSTKGRVPMGEFRAYETQSGLPVSGMTGENCGEMLLGVGRSVFERSAFLAQNAVAVTSDAELEKRLSSLVTTGDETVSFSDTQKTLRDWRNRCRHNRTGLLPQTLFERQQTEETLEKIHSLHQNDLTLSARREELTTRQARLQEILAGLKAREAAQALKRKDEAKQALDVALETEKTAQKRAARLPARETLTELDRQLTLLQSETGHIRREPETPLQAPECPEVFRGLSEEEILPKADADVRELDRLCAGKYRTPVPAWLALLAAVIFAVLAAVRKNWIFGVPAAVYAAAGIVWMIMTRRENRAREARLDQAQALMARYGNRARDELVPFAAQYCGNLRLYAQEKAQQEARRAQERAEQERLAQQRARLFGQVSMFAPGADTQEAALDAVRAAISTLDAADAAEREARTAQSRYDAVCAALGDVKPAAAPQGLDLTGYELRSVSGELLQINSALSDVRSQLDQNRGRVEALGDPAELEAKKEQLTAEAERLTRRYDALELALSTLEEANNELQTRFSPRISALSGALLGQMTGERYDTVLLGSDLRAETRERGELVTRQLSYLSGGTADQTYLAVRLAICRLALREDVPIVLDDALVRFDDERLRAALRLLRQEAEARQVVLFTCQSREQAALAQME